MELLHSEQWSLEGGGMRGTGKRDGALLLEIRKLGAGARSRARRSETPRGGGSAGRGKPMRWPTFTVALVSAFFVLLSASSALADTIYFQGNSCCANREFSQYYEYETSNAAANGGGYPQCVQEQVFPNWPNQNYFFDNYKCGNGSVSHPLNGENIDRALCWINAAPSPLNSCSERWR